MSDVIEKLICYKPNLILAVLFVLSVLFNLILIFSKMKKQTEAALFDIVLQNSKFVWYVFILTLSFAYSILHWDIVTKFSPFGGENLIFVVFIFLMLLPFIKQIQLYGFSANLNDSLLKLPFDKRKIEPVFISKENEKEKKLLRSYED